MKPNLLKILATLGVLTALGQAQTAPQYTISTIAGDNVAGYNGDNIAATSAELDLSFSAVSAGGNLYIADQSNQRIRYVVNGTISTLAGNGTGGFAGDGKSAGKAELDNPEGLAVDGSGNLYIADTINQVIRKVLVGTGIISTIAGASQTAGYAGDGGAAVGAQLNNPTGVALDSSGNIYIADTANKVIRKVLVSNNTIQTVAGNLQPDYTGDGGPATRASLNNPEGVALDVAGDIYIADTSNHRIRKVTVATGIITTIAGSSITGGFGGDGGTATKAKLNSPKGVAVDAVGNIYIADSFNNRIRIVMAATGNIVTIAGSGGYGYSGNGGIATSANFKFPSGVSLDSAGNLYVTDNQNNVIRMLTLVAQPSPVMSAIENSATGQVRDATHAVAPNSFVSIYATNLGTTTTSAPNIFPATSFQGVQVLFNGNPAPLYYVNPSLNLINVMAPAELPGTGTATIAVQDASDVSQSYTLAMSAVDVGLFRLSLDPAHPNNGAVRIANTALIVMPASTTPFYNLPTCAGLPQTAQCGGPAAPGASISIYFTGGGVATPNGSPSGSPVSTGSVAPLDGSILYETVQTPTVTIGGINAPPSFSGIAPGTGSEYQINIVIPAGVQTGDNVPVVVTIGNSTDTVTISVQNQ